MEVIVIAQDVQGAKVAKPWIEQAGGTFKALLDRHNLIGKLYNLKYVPVGILLDETGHLVRSVGSVNIDDQTFAAELAEWVTAGRIPAAWKNDEAREAVRALTPAEKEADGYLSEAVQYLQQDRKKDAIAALHKGYRLDPQNWLIRKQLWALENPDAFYAGPVDYTWQQQRIQQEDRARG